MAVKRDTRWLEQRRQGWYAVLYVPPALHSSLGKKLRKSLGTRDLIQAQRQRFSALAEFRARIEAVATSAPTTAGLSLTDALDLRTAWEAEREGETGNDDVVLDEIHKRGRKLSAAGGDGGAFTGLATGTATPLLHYVPEWLHEGGQKGAFEPRTRLQHGRTLSELEGWMKRVKLAPTLEALGRREAGRFVTECLARSDRQPKTMARIISSCRSYWTHLLRKGLVPGEKNPWDGQAPPKGASRGSAGDPERAFTDGEMRCLLAGPADAELSDLMRVAALTGMRIEEIYRLEARDCADGWFNVRKAKTRAGVRRVPIHAALEEIVSRRIKGRAAKD